MHVCKWQMLIGNMHKKIRKKQNLYIKVTEIQELMVRGDRVVMRGIEEAIASIFIFKLCCMKKMVLNNTSVLHLLLLLKTPTSSL